jgi:hypothetical protein
MLRIKPAAKNADFLSADCGTGSGVETFHKGRDRGYVKDFIRVMKCVGNDVLAQEFD